MDKFNRRPNARARRRRVFFVFLAFLLCAGCFLALFIFGNTGAMWVLGVYAFGLTLGMLSRAEDVRRNYRLWRAGLTAQSSQGPGFAPLEAAAISELLSQAGSAEIDLRTHLRNSEVVARYNSGTGGITTFRSLHPRPGSVTDALAWFRVEGLASVVGCRFWPDQDGLVTMLEFFTGGEKTSDVDWTNVSFEIAPAGAARPSPPLSPPVASEPRWVRYQLEV